MIRWLSHLHITFPLLKTGPEGSGHMKKSLRLEMHETSSLGTVPHEGLCNLQESPVTWIVFFSYPASWEVDFFASQISWYPELGTLNSHNHGFSEKWGLSPNHLVTFQKLLRLIFYVDEPTPDGSCLIKEFFWEKKHRNLLRKISFKPWTMLWTASPPCQCPIFWRFFWPGNGWKGEL